MESLVGNHMYADVVHLNSHKISTLTSELKFSPFLAKLFLQENNSLTAIPPSFFQHMPVLLVLDLSHTSIQSLPPSISKLSSLQEFILRECSLLIELPPEIGELKNLKLFDLEGTEIMYLPKEIGKLRSLERLRVSLSAYADDHKGRNGIQYIIPRRTILKLSKLKELSISVSPEAEWWEVELLEAIMGDLIFLPDLETLKLYLPTAKALQQFLRLERCKVPIYLSLQNYRFMTGHCEELPLSVQVDAEEDFLKLEKCVKYMNGEDYIDEMVELIRDARALYLRRHWTIRKLSMFDIRRLKHCLLMECNEMQTLFDQDDFCEQKTKSSHSEDEILGSLQYLSIHFLKKLQRISKGQIGRNSLSCLRVLALHTCPELTSIFTECLLHNLQNLAEVIVEDCPKVNCLVYLEGTPLSNGPFLPNLRRISLIDLPELVSISGDVCIAPQLDTLLVFNCMKLDHLSDLEIPRGTMAIKGEIEWWDALKYRRSTWESVFVQLKRDGSLMDQLAEDTNSLQHFLELETGPSLPGNVNQNSSRDTKDYMEHADELQLDHNVDFPNETWKMSTQVPYDDGCIQRKNHQNRSLIKPSQSDDEVEDGSGPFNQEPKSNGSSKIARNRIQYWYSSEELTETREPLICELVRDELKYPVEKSSGILPRPPSVALQSHSTTSFQLRFQTKLLHTYFTQSRIESEDTSAIKLVLFDANCNKIVSHGPLSSLKIVIVLLDGDFPADDHEDWPQSVFDAKVIHEIDGKRSLLRGNLEVNLKEGVADLGDVCFTHSSSWRRSRMCRIGAKAKSATAGVRIREAISEAFLIKDKRVKSYKKHHPPSLGDEIWSFENIAINRIFRKRLASHKIYTLKDFLQVYTINESLLRTLCGGPNNKRWKVIIKQAKTCILDDKVYMYSCVDGIGLLFNSILEVVGATFDGDNHLSMNDLNDFQKSMVDGLKHRLFKDLDGMIPINDLSTVATPVIATNLYGKLNPNSSSDTKEDMERVDDQLLIDYNVDSQVKGHPNDVRKHLQNERTCSRYRKASNIITHQVKVNKGVEVEKALDDGYIWRKYGEQSILGSGYPRQYYRCSFNVTTGCRALKQVQRSTKDPSIFEFSYFDEHTCHTVLSDNHSSASTKSASIITGGHFEFVKRPQVLDTNKKDESSITLIDSNLRSLKNSGSSTQAESTSTITDNSLGLNYTTNKSNIITHQVKVSMGIEVAPADDYSWRKYAQKSILGSYYPRHYYRCFRYTNGCCARKQVQRSDEDPSVFEVSYMGEHTCHTVLSNNQSSTATVSASTITDSHFEYAKRPQVLDSNKKDESSITLIDSNLRSLKNSGSSTPAESTSTITDNSLGLNYTKNKSIIITHQVKANMGIEVENAPDDGYSWRKYGQKSLVGVEYSRHYYRCTFKGTDGCCATKQVQRSDEDPSVFEVTYRGKHTCHTVLSNNQFSTATVSASTVTDSHFEYAKRPQALDSNKKDESSITLIDSNLRSLKNSGSSTQAESTSTITDNSLGLNYTTKLPWIEL